MATTNDQPATLHRGEGYLLFVGYLQLVAGAMTLLFSGMAVASAMLAADASWMNPVAVARSFGSEESGFFVRLIGAYMAFQFVFGWIFGLLMIVGGALSIRKRGRCFISAAAIVNCSISRTARRWRFWCCTALPGRGFPERSVTAGTADAAPSYRAVGRGFQTVEDAEPAEFAHRGDAFGRLVHAVLKQGANTGFPQVLAQSVLVPALEHKVMGGLVEWP